MRHEIIFSETVIKHLDKLRASERAEIIRSIEQQLVHEPLRPTKNRKPMRPNPLAEWELRIGKFRIYYSVNKDTMVVFVMAIGIKDRNRVHIDGKEIVL